MRAQGCYHTSAYVAAFGKVQLKNYIHKRTSSDVHMKRRNKFVLANRHLSPFKTAEEAGSAYDDVIGSLLVILYPTAVVFALDHDNIEGEAC